MCQEMDQGRVSLGHGWEHWSAQAIMQHVKHQVTSLDGIQLCRVGIEIRHSLAVTVLTFAAGFRLLGHCLCSHDLVGDSHCAT